MISKDFEKKMLDEIFKEDDTQVVDVTQTYNIYCPSCKEYQSFSADFDSDWTDLLCNKCKLIIATIEKK
jgi:hypothetical protein